MAGRSDGGASVTLAVRTMVAATMSGTVAILPVMLLGGLAVFIRRDLGFGETRLGLAVGVFFATSALVSVFGGRVTELMGAGRAMRLVVVGGATSLVLIALLARSWEVLVLCLALGGISNGICQPASNLALARGVPRHRQGVAFGMKQSAVPIATLLAGAAVPLLGLTIGWRPAFALGVLVAFSFFAVLPRDPRLDIRSQSWGATRRNAANGDADLLSLLLLALAAGIAVASANSAATFYVEASVTWGSSATAAGVWLSLGGVAGIVMRMLLGWGADRRQGGALVYVALLLLAGGVGFVVVPLASHAVLIGMGTLLVFGAGMGWNGLFHLSVVRLNPAGPAAATGITQTGMFVGGSAGPLAFGAVAEHLSYEVAWLGSAASLLLAAALILGARRRVLRLRDEPANTP